MPVHLEAHELRALILTIGTHRGDRPLSPIETGLLIRKAIRQGGALRDVADATQLQGTTQLGRFLKLLDLPKESHHLVDWGRSKGGVGFTTGFEVARLQEKSDKLAALEAVVRYGLSSAEARQLVQLRLRSNRTIGQCVEAVLKMRPAIEVRRVFIGAVTEPLARTYLAGLSQASRDALLSRCCGELGLGKEITAKLAEDRFTLIGPESGFAFPAGLDALEKAVNEWVSNQTREGHGRR